MDQFRRHFFNALFIFACFFVFCECLIYFAVIMQCSWPELDPKKADNSIESNEKPIKVMLLADTHLLGPRRGHWFDKLRREWQMHRSFQTAISLHNPEIIFVLGDLFDEGLWCSDAEFAAYVKRFHYLFSIPEGTEMFVVVGNHDIGFHYGISPYLKERFTKAFDSPSVKLLTVRGVHFVLVNSMAMEGDGCFLCRPAELMMSRISKSLRCTKFKGTCTKEFQLKQYSRPILLQHFPLYRESDEGCNEPDEAPEDGKRQKFRERWDCLSKESTELILDSLNPRLVVTGHTHHGCRRYHERQDAHEYTLPSFNWRNKDNPSFMLAVISPNNMAIEKCYLPKESTVICLYIVMGLMLVLYAGLAYRGRCRRNRAFKAPN